MMNSLTCDNDEMSTSSSDAMDDTLPQEESPSAAPGTLVLLKNSWNRLDQTTFHGYASNSKRQQYLKDIVQLRKGEHAYYSLGGDERQQFGALFTSLNSKLQESFVHFASQCLHENRIMADSDLHSMVLQEKGKRETGPVPCLGAVHQCQRPSKRARDSYFWLQGIHCFD